MIRMDKIKIKARTDHPIGCAFELINELGAGFLESVHEKTLLLALRQKGLSAECQDPVQLLRRYPTRFTLMHLIRSAEGFEGGRFKRSCAGGSVEHSGEPYLFEIAWLLNEMRGREHQAFMLRQAYGSVLAHLPHPPGQKNASEHRKQTKVESYGGRAGTD